ncbi:hypothetical protein G7Y89_g13598 [Cudoniella acicularis]|uniref:Uncharacterized protein n=1 Tax=Cudoniella acicularis TaxID=354080 RepID=A0A8H4R6K8_9HELO|nr:hypothetical protein G7Y89_g13598 [Cudoniella acicularis]
MSNEQGGLVIDLTKSPPSQTHSGQAAPPESETQPTAKDTPNKTSSKQSKRKASPRAGPAQTAQKFSKHTSKATKAGVLQASGTVTASPYQSQELRQVGLFGMLVPQPALPPPGHPSFGPAAGLSSPNHFEQPSQAQCLGVPPALPHSNTHGLRAPQGQNDPSLGESRGAPLPTYQLPPPGPQIPSASSSESFLPSSSLDPLQEPTRVQNQPPAVDYSSNLSLSRQSKVLKPLPTIGKPLDISNYTRHFSLLIPQEALSCSLLSSAIFATAELHGRMVAGSPTPDDKLLRKFLTIFNRIGADNSKGLQDHRLAALIIMQMHYMLLPPPDPNPGYGTFQAIGLPLDGTESGIRKKYPEPVLVGDDCILPKIVFAQPHHSLALQYYYISKTLLLRYDIENERDNQAEPHDSIDSSSKARLENLICILYGIAANDFSSNLGSCHALPAFTRYVEDRRYQKAIIKEVMKPLWKEVCGSQQGGLPRRLLIFGIGVWKIARGLIIPTGEVGFRGFVVNFDIRSGL